MRPFPPENPSCDLIGAWPIGCPVASVDALVPVAEGWRMRASPNPSSGEVCFELAPAAAGPADLRIFDCAGRLVRAFRNPEEGSSCAWLWNGRDSRGQSLASGVYFAVARAGEGRSGRAVRCQIVLRR